MAKQTINIGASPNDGTGTPLRTSFDYCNQNFTELYTATGPSGNNIVVPGNATITGALGAAGLNVTDATIPSNGVYLSAANNLAFSTGGSNRVTIDSGGTIGVGITAPFSDSGYKAIDLRGTTGGEVVLGSTSVREATITGDGTNGMTLNTVNATPLRFFTQGVERARFNTAGNLAFVSGKGIDFSAVTGGTGTATANVLNDYEEGTFTPSIATGATAVTYSTQAGSYTKIGRLVTVLVQITTSAATRNGSIFNISGLPFASSNFGSGVIAFSNSGFVSTAGGNKPNMYVTGSTVDFYTSSGSAFAGTAIATDAFDVRFTATYFV
jgi:hypothetical protein